MKVKRYMKLLGALALCLICLWSMETMKSEAQAKVKAKTETERLYEKALRSHFKGWGEEEGNLLEKDNGMLVLCLACLCGQNAQATESKKTEDTKNTRKTNEVSYEEGLRHFVNNEGKEYFGMSGLGKSNHCYYTYVSRKKEVVIIGFEETVKEIRIPDKIKGKKVKRIETWGPERLSYYTGQGNEMIINNPKISNSKTKCIVLSKYIKSKKGGFLQSSETLKNLEKIKVSSQNKHFMAKDGVLFSKDGKTLIEYPDKRKASNYKIPKGVTKLELSAFQYARVKKVIMPDTIKSVGDWCFGIPQGTSHLKSVRLSKSLKKIGKYAFCRARLTKISLPQGLDAIQDSAFSETDIKTLSLPKSLKSIGRGAFTRTNIRKVVIPGNVKKIPAGCFSSCKYLKKVTIKKGVKEIGNQAFEYCYQLRKLVVPPSVNNIEDPFAINYHYEGDEYKQNKEAWHKAKVIVYAKDGSHAYRKFNKKFWREAYNIKVKAM